MTVFRVAAVYILSRDAGEAAKVPVGDVKSRGPASGHLQN